jgi:adenylosuccinate synthase
MARKIVLLSGAITAGKSTLANLLKQRYGFEIVSTKDDLLSRREHATRESLQKLGQQLDKETGGSWVREALQRQIQKSSGNKFVVDAVRILDQVDLIRQAYGYQVMHIHLTASEAELQGRFSKRSSSTFTESINYANAKRNKTERLVEDLRASADVVIDTSRCEPLDVLARVAAHLDLYGQGIVQLVDVVIGGQYGSEGKGNIAHYLAPEYDYLIRVGGPNAGHKVYAKPVYSFRQLPSGTKNNTTAHLVLGPGSVIDIDILLREIADNSVSCDRLSIDPFAILISNEDKRLESRSVVTTIGSTGSGVGRATARKINYRHDRSKITLACDSPKLHAYIKPTAEVLAEAYSNKRRILLEGTQGTGLSLHHGSYPFVTSRDTTVSGCLAEAGIAPGRVRRTVLVCRTYPIRVMDPVGGTSGPMGRVLSWKDIADRSQYDEKELTETEQTTNTRKLRRVAEFSWDQLRRSVQLNGPTDLALTFADYISKENTKARRFEQLTRETIMFVEELEKVAGCHVSLICTRFNYRCIIDRRHWS